MNTLETWQDDRPEGSDGADQMGSEDMGLTSRRGIS